MRTTGISLVLVLILVGSAWGQTSSKAYRRYPSASNPALEYFVSTPAPPPRVAPRQRVPAPRPLQLARLGRKPFSNVQRPPTISPYLSLDIPQSGSALPNYYQYVRPQLQQQRANRAHQAEIHLLRQQLRSKTSTGIIANNPAGGIPTTGRSSQFFLNTGGYFSGGR